LKTAFSTNAFTSYSLNETRSLISTIGYNGIEIVVDKPHAFLPLKKTFVQKIRSHLKKNDLHVSNINANTVVGWYVDKNPNIFEKFEPSLSNENHESRKWRIEYTKRAIDFAYDLESPSICITSGVLNSDRKKDHLSFFENSLNEVSEYAEKYNIKIALEYEPGLLIGSANDVFQIISKYKNVGLNFDTCHAAVVGEDLLKTITIAREKLFHIHYSDCKNKTHYHLLPGKGDIDFIGMHKELSKIGYDGFFTAELYTYSLSPVDAALKVNVLIFKNYKKCI